jgi:hypothetical protein
VGGPGDVIVEVAPGRPYRPDPEVAELHDVDRVDHALRDFVEHDLMVSADDKYLSLALPENAYF